MRHRVYGKKLGRNGGERKALKLDFDSRAAGTWAHPYHSCEG